MTSRKSGVRDDEITAQFREIRARARRELPEFLSQIKPVLIHFGVGGAREVETNGRVVLSFDLDAVKRSSPEHGLIIEELLCLLGDQAEIANRAAAVAIADREARASGVPEAVRARKKQASDARNERGNTLALLNKEASRLRQEHPDMLVADIRARLAKYLREHDQSPRLAREVAVPRRTSKR